MNDRHSILNALPARCASFAVPGILVVVLAGLAVGQDAAPAGEAPAAPADAAVEKLTVTVHDIGGIVNVRESAEAPWRPATAGMTLAEGATVATAPRSFARLVIPGGQVVMVDRLSQLNIVRAELEAAAGKVKTDLGLPYGRMRYDVKTTEARHEATVRSPSATLTIRGTDAQVTDDAVFPTDITSVHGQVLAGLRGYRALPMGGTRRVAVNNRRPQPAAKARGDTRMDPRTAFAGRTEEDDKTVEQLPAIGGVDSLSFLGHGKLPRRGTELGSIGVESQLFFILEWEGNDSETDLDLEVQSPDPGDQLLTRYTTPVASRGVHNGQGVAGGDGEGRGRETAFWLHSPPIFVIPNGTYVATGRLVSEDMAHNVAITIQSDGEVKQTCTQTTLSGDNTTITCEASVRTR